MNQCRKWNRTVLSAIVALAVASLVRADDADLLWQTTLPNDSGLRDGCYRALRHSDREWYGSTFFIGPDWTRVGQDWHHPGKETPSVRCFIVPREGQVTVSGRVFKLHRSGDGIRALIRLNGREVWQQEIEGDDGQGVEHELVLEVREGDRLRFVVHKRGSITCDTTGWDPTVRFAADETYRASEAFAQKEQGAGGWRYEMQIDPEQNTQWPTLYAWSSTLALRQRTLRPGQPVTLNSSDRLPMLVVANGQDQEGIAVAALPETAWHVVASIDTAGDIKLNWYTTQSAAAETQVWSEPYTGSWAEGWMSIEDLLQHEPRFAALKQRTPAMSSAPRMSLALRAMVQVDWRRRDEIDGSAASFLSAAQRQWQAAEQLLFDLRGGKTGDFLAHEARQLASLKQYMDRSAEDIPSSHETWLRVRRLKRRIALRNPLLDFGPLLVCKRVPPSWSHLVAQYFGWRQRSGGGLFVINYPGHSLETRDVLQNQLPAGSVLEPRLSYNGRRILFAFVACDREVPDSTTLPVNEKGSTDRYFNLYEINVDGTGLRQLTDGPYDDMMGEYLPDDDIVFCSTRRKGYSRCFGPPYSRRWHSYTLHRMDADGHDIRTLSYNDVAEWFPAVSNSGHILHARWDYIDRDAVTHQNLWSIRPDGTNPVAVWGNASPKPHCTFQAKPIPGSNKIVFVASAHHAITAGPICVVDPTVDANSLDAVSRITPLPFPEAEGKLDEWYAAPWPLSENYFLVAHSPYRLRFQGEHTSNPNHALGVYLLDARGNRELLYRDPRIGTTNPIPLRSRPRPPVVPDTRNPSERTIGTMVLTNVSEGLGDISAGTIKKLRIVQLFPKTTWLANQPPMGVAGEENGRAILGTVPVEADGSAHFNVPAGKPILFQALDEHGTAYQTMRSLTFVQPGERTSCVGCHEHRMSTPPASADLPLALRRPASTIDPGKLGGRPFGFVEVVQPVLDRHCVRCHGKDDKLNLTAQPHRGFTHSYTALCQLPYDWRQLRGHPERLDDALVPRFAQRNQIQFTPPGGRYGARGSELMQLLRDGHEGVELSDHELYRLAAWIDMNAIFYGVYDAQGRQRQLAGEKVKMPDIQ